MTAPDQTAAFEADANHGAGESVEQLQARVRELEAQQDTPAAEVDTRPEIIGRDGQPVGDDADEDEKVEAPHTATVAGTEFRFYAPKPAALLAFGLGTSRKRDGQLTLATMQRFLGFHLGDDSYEVFMERMSDPHDEWGDTAFGELVNHIVEAAQDSAEGQAPKTGPANR